MRERQGVINVTFAIVFKIIIIIVGLIARRYLIICIGNEANGLNSLYVSIVGFLSVAELGVGGAIIYCMYKPIVNQEWDKVSALYHLFTKLYLIIGLIILACGCALMPALPYFAKGYDVLNVNVYLTFGLFLISIVISYFYSSKTSLINAYKNNYITTTINSIALIFQYGLQILLLVLTKSIVLFFACCIFASVLQWGMTELITRIKYKDIIRNRKKIDSDTKREVITNVKAMLMHKIGAALVNATDSLIISAFIGISILGKYSNYVSIVTAMYGVIVLCFTPLISVIGHLYIIDIEATKSYQDFLHTLNYILGVIFFLGYYAVINNLVQFLFGNGLEVSKAISFVITTNYFIQFMRQSTLAVRDATGTFYNDRWKPIAEGVINAILSILFVLIFPEEFKIVGVIVATIITDLFICHIVEPHVLYKYAFKSDAKRYYIKNYCYILVFLCALAALNFSMWSNDNKLNEMFANAGISLAYSFVLSAIAIMFDKNFRKNLKRFLMKNKSEKS